MQDWGLGFQCLTLVANQKTTDCISGYWLYILRDKHFSEMILKFISGTNMNLHKSNVVSVSSFNNSLIEMGGGGYKSI